METKYDKQLNRIEPNRLSSLQEKILRIICYTEDVDYHILTKETKRVRTTIIQSVQSLKKQHYVIAHRINPKLTKSKLIFRVTHKGLYYAIAFLDVDYDEMAKVYIKSENDLNKYINFIQSVPDYKARKEFLYQTAKLIMKYNPFDKNGMLPSTVNFQEIMNWGLRLAFLESAKQEDFDAANVLADKTLEQLSNISKPDEINEIKKFLEHIRSNTDSIIKRLSKTSD